MNTQKVLVGFVAVIAVISLVFSYSALHRDTNVSVSPQVGSITGPDNINGYWNYNGFQKYYFSQNIKSATSTLCAIATPRATSTLIAFYANVTSAGGSTDSAGGTFYIATSTSPFATTTNLFAGTLLPNATTTVSFLASTTDTTAQKWSFPAGSYVVFDVKGKTSYNYGGKCYAEFSTFQ